MTGWQEGENKIGRAQPAQSKSLFARFDRDQRGFKVNCKRRVEVDDDITSAIERQNNPYRRRQRERTGWSE